MSDGDLARLLQKYPQLDFQVISSALQEAQSYGEASKLLKRKTRRKDSLAGWIVPPPKKRQKTDKVHEKKKTLHVKTEEPNLRCISDVLRAKDDQPIASTSRLPVLTLGTPDLVARHSPCTLILDVLDQNLAGELYLEMIEESEAWQRNKWHLFDKEVESPHTTAFYVDPNEQISEEAIDYWYNGKKTECKQYTLAMEAAKKQLEPLVNRLLSERDRLPFEWAGPWRANVAAANCYRGSQESVGFHSDRLNYLGPAPTIASLTLGTSRIFRLRSVGPEARTFNIPLPHNSLIIMHAGCQENFKHCVPPQRSIDMFRLPKAIARELDAPLGKDGNAKAYKERINLTYRFYRPDFQSDNEAYPSLPRCKCGLTCNLRPDMKHTGAEEERKYFWQCQAEKNCGFFALLDMSERGPCIGKAA